MPLLLVLMVVPSVEVGDPEMASVEIVEIAEIADTDPRDQIDSAAVIVTETVVAETDHLVEEAILIAQEMTEIAVVETDLRVEDMTGIVNKAPSRKSLAMTSILIFYLTRG